MPPQQEVERKIFNDAEEWCQICHVAELGARPCVSLECRHVYHADCLHKRIEKRTTRRISLAHLNCPVCKEEI